jgi:protein-S-isoprenylcysteine O-methyltransferase Ste14
MPDLAFKIVYIVAILIEMTIRVPLNRQRRQNKIVTDRVNWQEGLLLGLLFLGMFFLPLLYIFTPWLNSANYDLPAWAGWLGVPMLGGALWVFWQSHRDLGRNWSPSLQIRQDHELVTNGIYHYIRHPMYASQWLWVIAQALLLQNWVAGVGGLILFLPLYLVRVPLEEQMMLAHFGQPYRVYMQRTGRVLPRLGKTSPF